MIAPTHTCSLKFFYFLHQVHNDMSSFSALHSRNHYRKVKLYIFVKLKIMHRHTLDIPAQAEAALTYLRDKITNGVNSSSFPHWVSMHNTIRLIHRCNVHRSRKMSHSYATEEQVALAAVRRACHLTSSVFNRLVKNETLTKGDKSPVTGMNLSTTLLPPAKP